MCKSVANVCMCPGRFDIHRPPGDAFVPCMRVVHKIAEYDYANATQVC